MSNRRLPSVPRSIRRENVPGPETDGQAGASSTTAILIEKENPRGQKPGTYIAEGRTYHYTPNPAAVVVSANSRGDLPQCDDSRIEGLVQKARTGEGASGFYFDFLDEVPGASAPTTPKEQGDFLAILADAAVKFKRTFPNQVVADHRFGSSSSSSSSNNDNRKASAATPTTTREIEAAMTEGAHNILHSIVEGMNVKAIPTGDAFFLIHPGLCSYVRQDPGVAYAEREFAAQSFIAKEEESHRRQHMRPLSWWIHLIRTLGCDLHQSLLMGTFTGEWHARALRQENDANPDFPYIPSDLLLLMHIRFTTTRESEIDKQISQRQETTIAIDEVGGFISDRLRCRLVLRLPLGVFCMLVSGNLTVDMILHSGLHLLCSYYAHFYFIH